MFTQSLSELEHLLADPKSDEELRSLAVDELASTNDDITTLSQQLQTSLIPAHPFAALPCLIELRPGAGGDEAALFAGDLLRMYTAYCKIQSLPATLLKLETEAGTGTSEPKVLEAVLEVDRAGAYDHFRCEAGVHRVQRIPATESKGRTHTSAVSVLVLPSFPDPTSSSSSSGDDAAAVGLSDSGESNPEDDPTSDYYVHTSEVRVETMRSRGAGGQHVNMTDSAVRLTHIPTGTVVAMQDQRSQLKNRQKAWQILRAKLAQARREAREEEMARLRVGVVGIARMGRGDKVRTYNWSQQRVTDHRCGVSVWGLDEVMAGGGGLSTVMEGVRAWLRSRDLEALVQEERESSEGAGKGKK